MLPEMRYIEGELLPMLRERAAKYEKSARRQLSQWKGGKGVCSLLLHVTNAPEMMKLPVYDNEEIHYDVEKMFVSQLRAALSSALADGDAVPSSVQTSAAARCARCMAGLSRPSSRIKCRGCSNT